MIRHPLMILCYYHLIHLMILVDYRSTYLLPHHPDRAQFRTHHSNARQVDFPIGNGLLAEFISVI